MATIKPLIDYLPQYMQQYVEMQKIMDAEQTELDSAWDGLNSVWNNQYLFEADSAGISRWESMLGIVPKLTDTLDERKFRIFTLMNQELPYTYTKLIETLTTLCGTDWSIVFDADNYSIEIKLGLANRSNMSAAEDVLKKMVPANMVVTVSILYNRHSALHAFTNGYLSNYTHDELRNEVIE